MVIFVGFQLNIDGAVNLLECFMSSQQKKVTKLARQLLKAISWLSNCHSLAATSAEVVQFERSHLVSVLSVLLSSAPPHSLLYLLRYILSKSAKDYSS